MSDFAFDTNPVADPKPRQRRPPPQKSHRTLWLIGGALLGVLLAGAVVAAVLTTRAGAGARTDGKASNGPGVLESGPQNHAELLEYLNKRGANLMIEGGAEVGGKPASAFRDRDAKPKKSDNPYDTDWEHLNNFIVVTMHPDSKSAADAAAAGGSTAFAWGRFVFEKRLSKDDVFDRIRKALK